MFQIYFHDFKYWEIYPTIEEMQEGEQSCLYPPRFKVKCRQKINTAEPLYFSLEISKKFTNKDKENVSIGKFPLIKEPAGTTFIY